MAKSRRKHSQQLSKMQGQPTISLEQLEQQCKLLPESPAVWKGLAAWHLQQSDFEQAKVPAKRAYSLAPDDPSSAAMYSAVLYSQGEIDNAISLLESTLSSHPKNRQVAHDLGLMLYRSGYFDRCLVVSRQGLRHHPETPHFIQLEASALKALHSMEEARELFLKLTVLEPENFRHWIDIGNIQRDLGELDNALKSYQAAMDLCGNDASAYSNYLTTLHYHGEISREDIFEACSLWQKKYSPSQMDREHSHLTKTPGKKLRIGLLSDGFKSSPVGQMITSALESFPKDKADFIAFSTNDASDAITERLKKCCIQWNLIAQIHGKKLFDLIQNEKIDILIDLAGHNNGSRMPVIAMKPAPIIIKWVGGLINTTAVDAIDYLISDSVETPEGDDRYYTEKIIRMPDDYICYTPPSYAPMVENLPAKNNNHITFGCFNNPTKLNSETLVNWASILHQVPNSKLLLKSFQFNSNELKSRILDEMQNYGIESYRLIIEGPSPHRDLLAAYNRVDIALDPWPYSGGLTTCEALLMGVPVVTHTGPTFAGRHSATHLINAGMPELVTDNWKDYQSRVIELVSDLDSLSTIRSHLRAILLHSPVCNPIKFSTHLSSALCSIWKRYCHGLPPAPVSFSDSGQAVFKDQDELNTSTPSSNLELEEDEFRWLLDGKVIALDHGGRLLENNRTISALNKEALEIIVFDPASNWLKNPKSKLEGVQYYPNISLGNGDPLKLYACQAPCFSGTIAPLDKSHFADKIKSDLTVLATLPLNSFSLDRINRLPSIDWLALDNLHDSDLILKNGIQSLKNTLLIQAEVSFQATHKCQPDFSSINKWAESNNFRFYCFIDDIKGSSFSNNHDKPSNWSNELISSTALFIPTHEKLLSLSPYQRTKLAFISDAILDLYGLCFDILGYNSKEDQERYYYSRLSNADNKINEPEKKQKTNNHLARLNNISSSSSSASEDQEIILAFFPDYSQSNPYQKLFYEIFPDSVDIKPGVPWGIDADNYKKKIFHLHWEDSIYREAISESIAFDMVFSFIESLKTEIKKGWKIIWTIHNDTPHENTYPQVSKYIQEVLAELADTIILHSNNALKQQSKKLPIITKKYLVIPNGSYYGYYAPKINKKTAQLKLNIDVERKVFLFFGLIRPYKGLDKILKAFSSPEVIKQNCILAIAGTGPAQEYIDRYYTGPKENIKVFNRFIDDSEVNIFFSASDFSIYAFKKILNSGSIMLSYSFNTPAIVPKIPELSDFSSVETGTISYIDKGINPLKKAIINCCNMSNDDLVILENNAKKTSINYAWKNYKETISNLINKLTSDITIVVFGRNQSDIFKWIEQHRNKKIIKNRIIFAIGEQVSIENQDIFFENLPDALLSPHIDSDPMSRVAKTLSLVESEYVSLCASDDIIEKLPDIDNSDQNIAGFSSNVTFFNSDGTSFDACSNDMILSSENVEERIESYWTYPFPMDNSVFYSTFKTQHLLESFSQAEEKNYEAFDWVLLTILLTKGKIIKSDAVLLRHKTPSHMYTENYIKKSADNRLKNPLNDARNQLIRILSPNQYAAIKYGLDTWISIKEKELSLYNSGSPQK